MNESRVMASLGEPIAFFSLAVRVAHITYEYHRFSVLT